MTTLRIIYQIFQKNSVKPHPLPAFSPHREKTTVTAVHSTTAVTPAGFAYCPPKEIRLRRDIKLCLSRLNTRGGWESIFSLRNRVSLSLETRACILPERERKEVRGSEGAWPDGTQFQDHSLKNLHPTHMFRMAHCWMPRATLWLGQTTAGLFLSP